MGVGLTLTDLERSISFDEHLNPIHPGESDPALLLRQKRVVEHKGSRYGKDLFSAFQQNHDLVKVVRAWESGETETMMLNGAPAEGTAPGGPHMGQPVFAYKVEPRTPLSDGGLQVMESDNCIAFIPGGFRDAATVNTMNPVREDIGGLSALMSLAHVLTMPKNVRIYNAATLKEEHLPLLEEMKNLGQKAVEKLLNGGAECDGSVRWQLAQEGTITMKDNTVKNLRLVGSDMSPGCAANLALIRNDPEQLSGLVTSTIHSFHVYPAASVGYLHLHSYVEDLLTSAHDSMEADAKTKGYKKNTPYLDVVTEVCGHAHTAPSTLDTQVPRYRTCKEVADAVLTPGMAKASTCHLGLSSYSKVMEHPEGCLSLEVDEEELDAIHGNAQKL